MTYNLTHNNNYWELVLRKSFPSVTGHLLLTGNTTLKWTQCMTLGNVIVVYNPSTVYVCRHQSTGGAVAPTTLTKIKVVAYLRFWENMAAILDLYTNVCMFLSPYILSLYSNITCWCTDGDTMLYIYIGCCCIVHSTCTVQQHIIYTHTILYIVLLCITFNTTHWFQSANDYSTRKGSLVTVG